MKARERQMPADEFSRRRLAKRIARAVEWLYRREVKRAVMKPRV